MKTIIACIVSLMLVGCSMVYHIDTKYLPSKFAGLNWRDGKFPAEEHRIFGTFGGEEMFAEPTGKSKFMTPDEYCAQWEMEAERLEMTLSGVTSYGAITTMGRRCIKSNK